MSREVFARLVPTSVRNLASLESGQSPSPVIQKNLTELQRVISALEDVVKQEAIGPWMDQPNAAFEGLKPIEVIERGEIDRIWRMLYQLQSGDAF
ncbi:antitoxin Xre/MbcA/ParS toxin-binding domain-containing protein [Rosistilla oblonga]|uniref:antitoxin Xre/MbcA/ParS toxin-binding domain-containing protein n=1 Tax=Rosistilla oblonga TaxID=2527990 RepID=UPI003A987A84